MGSIIPSRVPSPTRSLPRLYQRPVARSPVYWTRYVLPGTLCQTRCKFPPETPRLEMRGSGNTTTLKLVLALNGGAPSSVTRTLRLLVLGAWSAVGRQVNRPVIGLIDAPSGAPASNE